jgi:endoglucanase
MKKQLFAVIIILITFFHSISSMAASTSGTSIPPSSQITDAKGNTWTLAATKTIFINGLPAGYTSNVILILYYNGTIYQENSAGGWWAWINGNWAGCGDPRSSQSSGPSPSGTSIPQTSQIIDAKGNTWTLSASKTVLLNGTPAGYTNNVILILYYNGTIYQENSAGGWWAWTNGAWVGTSNPQTNSSTGSCGSSNGVGSSILPTTNLCNSGIASIVTGNGTLWNWTCGNTSCSAPVQSASVNGYCGSANGSSVKSAPSSNLCSSGVATAVSGNGPWTWTCGGTGGGSDATCTASLSQSASFAGATIPSASQIVDSKGNTWTLSSSNTVLINGNAAGYTSNVSLILYYNGTIYQENSSGGWWSWTNGAWTGTKDPRAGACGSANGVPVSSAPTANLCSGGTQTSVSGNGPWTWGCTSNGTTVQCSAPSANALSNRFGVNLAGAEFGQNFPGTYGVDYGYPTASELDYYKNKGMTLIRMPFAWERMQPALNGPLDAAQVGYMTNFLNAADARGMSVILDVHNYGRYGTGSFNDFTSHGSIIGTSTVPVSAFANFWSMMATQFKGHSSLLGYDLMNEPHDMGGASVWPTAAQAAVNAIRSVDKSHIIFVEGDGWAGAWAWATYNGGLNINDPSNNLVYEAHQYFDSDNSGTYTSSYDAEGAYPNVGVDRLQPFALWISQHGYKGWVGESGVPNNDPRWLTVLNNFLAALKSNGLWGTYWAGGPMWGGYPLSCEPNSGQDAAQMSVLQNYPSN